MTQLQEKFYISEIETAIKKDGIAKLKTSLFKKLPPSSENDNPSTYFCQINKDNQTYTGFLSEELIRNSFGSNKYSNGDIYIGQWSQNKKQGFGIYKFNKSNGENEMAYIGTWKDGFKEGEGILIVSNKGTINEIKANGFTLNAGSFRQDKFHSGFILTYSNNMKEMSYQCELKNERVVIQDSYLFKGTFNNNEFIQGDVYELTCNNNNNNCDIIKAFSYAKNNEDENLPGSINEIPTKEINNNLIQNLIQQYNVHKGLFDINNVLNIIETSIQKSSSFNSFYTSSEINSTLNPIRNIVNTLKQYLYLHTKTILYNIIN